MPEEPFSPTTRYGYTEAEIKAHREAWLKDLESGEYPQGKGALAVTSSEDGSKTYCCMGVACETALKNGLDVRVTISVVGDPNHPHIITYYNGIDGVFPLTVRQWLGFGDSNPSVDGHTLAE